jgi:hypothetical protein
MPLTSRQRLGGCRVMAEALPLRGIKGFVGERGLQAVLLLGGLVPAFDAAG